MLERSLGVLCRLWVKMADGINVVWGVWHLCSCSVVD